MKTSLKQIILSTILICGVLCLSSFTVVNDGTFSDNGIKSVIPAYYDGKIFNIIFVEFSSQAEATLIDKNPGINFIYQSDPGLPGGQPFISVIDAIPGDGMNPVWQEVQIVFNTGFTPHQFFSDEEVLAAATGSNPEITLNFTTEVYKCPVIGHK